MIINTTEEEMQTKIFTTRKAASKLLHSLGFDLSAETTHWQEIFYARGNEKAKIVKLADRKWELSYPLAEAL